MEPSSLSHQLPTATTTITSSSSSSLLSSSQQMDDNDASTSFYSSILSFSPSSSVNDEEDDGDDVDHCKLHIEMPPRNATSLKIHNFLMMLANMLLKDVLDT
jgi:hypothetical protein